MSEKIIKILFVEDEIGMVEMYEDKFSEEGYSVVSALIVEEGLAIAKKEKPNLIILDILLPTENGIAFLEKMRKDPAIAKIPVVALSNYDEPKTKKQAFDLQVKDYLIKTQFTPKKLIQEIKKYLPFK